MFKKIAIIGLLIASISNLYATSKGTTMFSYEKFYRLNTPNGQVDATDWAGMSLDGEFLQGKWDGKAEADSRYYFVTSHFNHSVPELYLGYTASNKKHQTYLGRKLVNWSENESSWNLGNLNSNQSFTLLSEKQEGLVGLHHMQRFGDVKLDIFFSYFFVPQLNPDVSVEDGQIATHSEWLRKPPSETVIVEQVRPIYYEVNMPDVKDVVFKKSLGARLSIPLISGEISFYGIYKPENKLRMNADARYVTSRKEVVVTANPVVNHHLFYGLQAREYFGDVVGTIGVDVTDPNARLGNDFRVVDPIKLREDGRVFESEYFSVVPTYDRESYGRVSFSLDKEYFFASFNYIHLLSSNTRGDDFYTETVKWQKAVGAQLKYKVRDDLQVGVDLKYDLSRKDNVLSSSIDYSIAKSMELKIGLEFIQAPEANSYWTAYRANDTVYTALVYKL